LTAVRHPGRLGRFVLTLRDFSGKGTLAAYLISRLGEHPLARLPPTRASGLAFGGRGAGNRRGAGSAHHRRPQTRAPMFDRSRRRPATEVGCGADAVPVEHDRPTGSDRCRSPSTGAALATACSCGLRSTPPGGLCTSTGMHVGLIPGTASMTSTCRTSRASAADAGPGRGCRPCVTRSRRARSIRRRSLTASSVGNTPSLPLPEAGEKPVVVRPSWVMRRSLMSHADPAPVARS